GGHPVKRFFTWLFILLVLGGGSAWLYLRLLPPPPPPPPPGEIERLTALREALGEQFKELVVEGGEKSLERAPRGDIMIGLPTSLTRGIAEKVTTGLFGETTVRLQNLKVHKEGEVKAKMIFAKRKVGQFVLDATILEARALVRPGKPTLTFKERRIGIGLPFDLADGGGQVELHFAWDSQALAANLSCGALHPPKVSTPT